MAQPYAGYKFSTGEDPNDPGMMSKAIGKMKLRTPETYGGALLESTTTGRQYDEFNIHTPPDITQKTRVVAVCGLVQEDASPADDGWFLSDFFAFHHLFSGLTKHQTWIHCLDLHQLVTSFRPYLHGSPFKTRKVVMDHDIISKAQDIVQCNSAGGLKLMFKKALRKEVQEAAKAGDESVLVFIFGHGREKHFGVQLGTQWLKHQEFQNELVHDVPTTILSTACFSGGWSCNKTFDKKTNELKHQFNKTTMMAAGREATSHSWSITATLGRRFCGSVFASALVESLTRVNDQVQLRDIPDNDEVEITPEQERTYAAFCETVTETLLKDVDRLGFEHEITFSAENDAWNMCWRERTGFPLASFKKRWDTLADHPADPHLHPGDPLNKDPHVTSEQAAAYLRLEQEDGGIHMYSGKKGMTGGSLAKGGTTVGSSVLGKRKTSGMYGGTLQALINQVSCLGRQYLDSYNVPQNTGNDGSLWNRINRIHLGELTDRETVENVLRCIQYRMEQMTTADRYLAIMGVPPPMDQDCHEFDTKSFKRDIDSGRYREMIDLIFERELLFPPPMNDSGNPALNQGLPFYKGHHYVIAAFYYAKMSKSAVIEKLDLLEASVKEVIEEEVAKYKQVPEIKSKRHKLFHVFGLDLGSISPLKRRSRGQSLGSYA
ncbi:MAG: hypothetical protein Q9205_003613 [Flavoplaca limonia]